MTTNDPGFTPDYTQYQPTALTVAQLDQIATFVFTDNGTSAWGSVIAGAKLAVAIAYVLARQKLVDNQLLIQQQQYEASQTNQNHNDANQLP